MLVRSYLLQLLVAFFMGRKSSAAWAAWCAEACLHLSSLSFALCGSETSSELKIWRPEVENHPCSSAFDFDRLIRDGQGEYSDQPDPCDGSEPRVIQK
ncbi:hypothetical protein IGI04_022677 [Brassica rapa subsp. trilocularis]|uniref:Secreted protein n=1 Tax=Brassica rapa subsp. trilocularis TaxID=1813537 RepID=A0ABQ7M537_BRACM|nr:hypothetical protein IGI04_022677 [Brassica rapa subsp. trilocularis]